MAKAQIPDAAAHAAMSEVLMTKAEAVAALTAAFPHLPLGYNGYEIAKIIANHDKKLGAAIRLIPVEPAKAPTCEKSQTEHSNAQLAQSPRPLEEWHEDHGNVVWWAWDKDRKEWFGEPAYIGMPLDSDWPDYHTHWTPHPAFPTAPQPPP